MNLYLQTLSIGIDYGRAIERKDRAEIERLEKAHPALAAAIAQIPVARAADELAARRREAAELEEGIRA